ncbi:MAG: YceI family protein [Ilumatobacter sp.]|nr:YceI family protein [Ilumatobacter sp.]
MTDPAPNVDDAAPESGQRFPRWLKWGLLGALAILVIGYGLIFLYAKVLNDSPDELGQTDLDAALAAEPPATTAAPEGADGTTPTATEPPPATDATETTTSPTTAPAATPETTAAAPLSDGAALWNITEPSELGYRVKEILFGVDTEAVGRTDQITGSITIDGTQVVDGNFVVDVASIESDDGRRDSQFRGRIMSVDEFPEAIFVLTEPIELGTESADGVSVEATATGELTLRGVTNPVTFDVTAEQANGRIGVLGNIPVVFEDYDIDNPSIGGITTEDNGLLEFVLVFEPAA